MDKNQYMKNNVQNTSPFLEKATQITVIRTVENYYLLERGHRKLVKYWTVDGLLLATRDVNVEFGQEHYE